ncbi:MAG: CaiB/BaiF CoA-transferase family protein [Pseudomonadota bacterium]
MPRALDGIKVLELAQNLPGNYLGWLLAGLGAEVLKLERPPQGDPGRSLGGADGVGPAWFAAVNRRKKSLILDFKQAEGLAIARRLAGQADVVVEGFRPGVSARLGLDYASLSASHPGLVYVAITGYGQEGPWANRAGHDLNYLALSGVLHLLSRADAPPPVPGVQIADLFGGALLALAGLLAALFQRQRTGVGQMVDAAMCDGSLALATMIWAGVAAGKEPCQPGGMLLGGAHPCYNVYCCADGGYLTIGALETHLWANFCRAVGRPDLIERQFAGPETIAEVAAIIASRTRRQWQADLAGVDACCEPVLSLKEALDTPQVRERGLTEPDANGQRQLALPLRLSASPPPAFAPAPGPGQHSDQVLQGLGYHPEQIARLRERGVVA